MWLVKIALTFGAFWVLGQHASWACSYPATDSLHQAQKDCTQRPDRSWSCDLHRCIATREVLKVASDLAQCDAIENHEEANRCRVKTAKELTEAQKAVDLDKNKLKTKNYLGLGTQSLLGSYYLLAGFSQKAGSTCGSLAGKLLAAGGGSAIMGALWASWRLETNAKKLQQQYRKLVESKSVKNAQVEAFDYLISEQKAVARAAKNFATANNLAAGLFAAGAIAATFNQLKPAAGCATSGSLLRPPLGVKEGGGLLVRGGEPPGNGGGGETVKALGQLSGEKLLALAFPLAYGGQGLLATLLPVGTGVGLGVLLKTVKTTSINPLQKFFNTPYGQITLGSVGAAVSLYAASVYNREAKAAKKRSQAVQEMRDAFVKRVGFYACPQRNDPREPQCFCFIKDNIINPERKTSQACEEYFVQKEDNWDPRTYSRYEVIDQDRPACLTRQGVLDPGCLCREQKLSNGDNNCQKISISLTEFNGAGVSPTVGRMVRDANYLTNGKTPLSKLNSADLGQGAIKLRKALERVSSSVDKELRKRGREGGVVVTPALLRRGLGAINRALGSGAMTMARQFNGGLGTASSQGHVVPEAKKIFRQMQKSMRRGKWPKNNARRGEDIDSLLGLNKKEPPARDQASLAGGSQYDYKGHDIHPSSGASIWQVLSNRYQQTGLSRLFKAQP